MTHRIDLYPQFRSMKDSKHRIESGFDFRLYCLVKAIPTKTYLFGDRSHAFRFGHMAKCALGSFISPSSRPVSDISLIA